MKRTPLNRLSKREIPKLKRKADLLNGALVRERDKGKACIDLCGRRGKHQNGHFRRRELMITRYHPNNQNGQTEYCNCWDNDTYRHAKGIDARWGAGTAEYLDKLSRQTKQWDAKELTELIAAMKLGYDEYVDKYVELTGQIVITF